MDDLFGSTVKPIDELGAKQLKNSVDRAISELQTYMEECPTKNEIPNLLIHASSQFRKTKQKLSAISQKIEILVNHTSSNHDLIKILDNKVHSMINLVERIPVDTTKEENNLKMALEALLRKMNGKRVEEVKILIEIKEPLLDLEKCSLHELMSILQRNSNDPSINANQAGFGSYIANHVLNEKIARYNQEAMIPPKLGDAWIPKVLVTIGKETLHAILDLGSSVSILSKEIYELLKLQNIENALLTCYLLMILLNML
jgi:hypothetical protein